MILIHLLGILLHQLLIEMLVQLVQMELLWELLVMQMELILGMIPVQLLLRLLIEIIFFCAGIETTSASAAYDNSIGSGYMIL